MKKIVPFFLFLLVGTWTTTLANNFQTPGTGVKWSLADLQANSGGDLLLSGTEYFVQDTITISVGDTLEILTNETVKFIAFSYLQVNGVLIIDPPTEVLFTAQDIAARFHGIRLDSSDGSILRKLRFEYGNSLRIFDCSPLIEGCTFRYNAASTSFGRTVIDLYRSKAIIKDCIFTDNIRIAIASGANVASAPRITGCFFARNNTINENKPQINLGTSGSDTTFILNNTFHQAAIRSGGIGFLPLGDVYTVISGNTILNNRFGIVLQGGSNIHALISYNHIEGNNIEGNPNLGGSGISFAGGTAGNHQNSIVTGNLFKNNLWGITIQNNARPNLGNLSNADTSDDGKNQFINNTNASVPGIDLYNNTNDPIDAQGNYWYSDIPSEVESKIFHLTDDPTLGLVNYSNFLLPVHLLRFDASRYNHGVLLQWETATETNSSHFDIERSINGVDFQKIGSVHAVGNSNATIQYQYEDPQGANFTGIYFYRLKLVDADNHFSYSPIESVAFHANEKNQVKIFPTNISGAASVQATLLVEKAQIIHIRLIGANGKVLQSSTQLVQSGFNQFNIPLKNNLPDAILYLQVQMADEQKTIPLINIK